MNFFQFAQTAQANPVMPFTASSSPALKLPTSFTNDFPTEIPKSIPKTESIQKSNEEIISNSPYPFNKKKVTFVNLPEDLKPSKRLDKFDEKKPQNDAVDEADEDAPMPNKEEITEENVETHLARLEEGFKFISSWSQIQKQGLQKIEEEIGYSKIQANQVLASINSIMNSETIA